MRVWEIEDERAGKVFDSSSVKSIRDSGKTRAEGCGGRLEGLDGNSRQRFTETDSCVKGEAVSKRRPKGFRVRGVHPRHRSVQAFLSYSKDCLEKQRQAEPAFSGPALVSSQGSSHGGLPFSARTSCSSMNSLTGIRTRHSRLGWFGSGPHDYRLDRLFSQSPRSSLFLQSGLDKI